MIGRLAAVAIVGLLAYAGVQAAWRVVEPRALLFRVQTSSALAAEPAGACAPAPAFAEAAAQNAGSLDTAAWSVFSRPSQGWAIYAPLTAHELATACDPKDAGFAKALAAWQGQHGLPANGVMDQATLKAFYGVWQSRRPFVAATAHGGCPPPPQDFRLAFATPSEGYSGKQIQLRTTALNAYRQMALAARREVPSLAGDKQLMTIFSGYRGPAEEAARCASGGCNALTKASCSAHRTGLAMDFDLGSAPGFGVDSSADPNRLYMSKTPLYHWLAANAGRFGFVPYPFEPWHWEWTGEPI